MDFSITNLIAVLISTFFTGESLLSPTATRVSASLIFFIFSSKFNMCDVAPEYTRNVSMSWFLFDVFAIKSFSYITSYVSFFADYFSAFSFCINTFLRDCLLCNN